MNKKIFLAGLLCLASVASVVGTVGNAHEVEAATPTTVYLKPNVWSSDGAKFQAWVWGAGDQWVTFTDSDGDGVYETEVPSGTTGLKILRKDPSSANNSWTSWNDSGDQSLPTDGRNMFVVKNWGSYEWQTYTPPVGHVSQQLTLVGTLQTPTQWDTNNAAYTLVEVGETNIYELELELEPGSYEFKIAKDNAWTVSYGLETAATYNDIMNSISFKEGSNSKNTTLVASGGKYRFSYDYTNKKMSVTHTSYAELNSGLTTLLSTYYNGGYYTRNTTINLNEDAKNELVTCFHAKANDLVRTTVFKGDSLTMTIPGNSTYSSTYGTEEIEGVKYMTHSGSGGEYRIANDSMEDHYTTLFDIKDATNVKWTMNENVWSCANEDVISLFLDFTAPCFLGLSDDKANYFSLDHVEVEQKGESLELRLVTTGDTGKLTDTSGVLSVALITK